MTDTPIPSPPMPPAAAQPTTVVNQTPAGVLDQNVAALLALNTTQKKKRKSKAHLNAMKMRGELWPELDTSLLWDRTVNDGYSSIPRTLSLITNMIDDLAKKHTGKSAAAGKTYFALWCRVWDENMLTIENESVYAIESGYSGERNVTTWRQHMKVLQELGFIDTKEGAYGPYNFVLIYNPYLVLKKLKPQIPASYYQLLLQRAIEIGADGDLIDKPAKETK